MRKHSGLSRIMAIVTNRLGADVVSNSLCVRRGTLYAVGHRRSGGVGSKVRKKYNQPLGLGTLLGHSDVGIIVGSGHCYLHLSQRRCQKCVD